MNERTSNNLDFDNNPFQSRGRFVAFWILLGITCFIRLWKLDYKTMMHDELLFTTYTYYDLYQNWRYEYLPILHGPLALHWQNLMFHIFGVSDYTVRLGVAVLGIGSFFFLWKLRYWLREPGTWAALSLYAFAPGIVFFQRFFHMDSMYLFCTLWIIASLANWWRTRDGRWAASAIIAITALFNNKASAVFVYFTVLTFVILVVLHDALAYLMEGKGRAVETFLVRVPRMPSTWIMGATVVVIVTLVLTQVFEGLKYDSDVVAAIGHDWVLRDVTSIPMALGWYTIPAGRGLDAGAAAEPGFWRLFYSGLILGSLALAFGLKLVVERRVGRDELATRFWDMVCRSRYYIVGGLAFSLAFYILNYTTLLKFPKGVFQIYERTWSYWGGQHEWGRIGGPFHQHMLNIVIYELPATLVVVGAWIAGLFQVAWRRTTGFAFILMAVPVAAFHKLMFSGYEFQFAGAVGPVPADVMFLKHIFFAMIAAGVITMVVPRAGKAILPIGVLLLAVYSFAYFASDDWTRLLQSRVYQDGAPVRIMKGDVTFAQFIEVQFNFDGGTSLAIVILLIVFATIYTWNALDRGDKFRALLVWWAVTMIGSASYAREAVPQVGIHAMLPVVLLAASYFGRLWEKPLMPSVRYLVVGLAVIGIGWSAKTSINMNIRRADDPVERMAYGPSYRDVKNHMDMIRAYAGVAGVKLSESGQPIYLTEYNNRNRHKDVRIYIKTLDQVTWPAKWYLRDVAYEEGGDPGRAIEAGYDFVFLAVGDDARFPELREKYNVYRGRGTTFWTPNLVSFASIGNIWKEFIPGHYLDRTPEAVQAYNAKQDWYRLWRYMLMRESFDGTGRNVPSISSFEYLFCVRKDLI